MCPVCEPNAAPGPQLPDPGRPQTVGPFPAVLGAPPTACPADSDGLCPASPPLGGTIWQGPRPRTRLPEADVCIDISWYQHLTEAD